MSAFISRRKALHLFGASAGVAVLPKMVAASPGIQSATPPFTYCLNMATLRGHNLGFVKELEVAAQAGFRSVEIWIDTLQAYLEKGGTLADARMRLNDAGITVENSIGFAPWIVDDDAKRQEGLAQMQKEMEILAAIGCKRIAAPPVGATDTPGLNLDKAAARYRAVLELGDTTGVVPQLEMWGFSKNLSRAADVMYVAMQSGHPSAKVLLDVFHLYKGGTPLNTLHLVNPAAVDILHMNDYPAHLSPDSITDADRTYAGDGVAPLANMLRLLRKEAAEPLILSTEVFNKNYYSQNALLVAKTALEKMKKVTGTLP